MPEKINIAVVGFGNIGSYFYKTLEKVFNKSNKLINKCLDGCETRDLILVEDSIVLMDSMLSDVGNKTIKKKYEQDMSKVNMENLSENKKEILTKVSLAMKIKKIKKTDSKKRLLIFFF